MRIVIARCHILEDGGIGKMGMWHFMAMPMDITFGAATERCVSLLLLRRG